MGLDCWIPYDAKYPPVLIQGRSRCSACACMNRSRDCLWRKDHTIRRWAWMTRCPYMWNPSQIPLPFTALEACPILRRWRVRHSPGRQKSAGLPRARLRPRRGSPPRRPLPRRQKSRLQPKGGRKALCGNPRPRRRQPGDLLHAARSGNVAECYRYPHITHAPLVASVHPAVSILQRQQAPPSMDRMAAGVTAGQSPAPVSDIELRQS